MIDDPTLRPRRSVLYMPGANTRALEKAKGLPADAVILDLEDAVAPDAKPEARANVVAAVEGGGYGRREIAIRVNGLGTPWGPDDVRAAAGAGPDAVLVPKVSSAADVHAAVQALDEAGAADTTALWVMLETPEAVLRAAEVAGASDRLTVLVMGTNDLSKELRCAIVPGREPMLYALGACVAAARASGKAILDGVYNAIDDADGFAAECRQGADMGFDGKTLVHPSQLEPCNAAYAPSEAELVQAGKIIEAWEAARAEGKGVVTVDGRMVENLHVDNARRALAMADAIAALQDT